MKRKTLISVVLTIIMLLNCIAPLGRVYAAESSTQTITLNSELYTAVSEYMKSNYTGFAYNDLLRTITANGSSFASVDELKLTAADIDDVTGLEVFTGLKRLDLSGNKLTLDSNLEVINSLTSLEKLDLSTNKIDGFSWLTLGSVRESNLHSQEVSHVEVITIKEDAERDDNNTKLKGLINELDLESKDVTVTTYLTDGKRWNDKGQEFKSDSRETKYVVGDDVIEYEDNKFILKGVNARKNANEMYNIEVEVTGTNKYVGSVINLYYIITDEDQEGIVFKDENFYKAVKKQLFKRMTPTNNYILVNFGENYDSTRSEYAVLDEALRARPEFSKIFGKDADEFSTRELNWNITTTPSNVQKTAEFEYNDCEFEILINTPGSPGSFADYSVHIKIKRIYDAAYDKALTLVINKDVLWNSISNINADNEKIHDLTGLEKFVGLSFQVSLKYNYIDSIEKIVELEENKEKAEQEIRDKISELINKITSKNAGLTGEEIDTNYLEDIKKYLDLEDELAKTEDEEKRTELESQKPLTLETASIAAKAIIEIFGKIYETYNESEEGMLSILTPELYSLENLDELDDKDDVKRYLTDEISKLNSLEEAGAINETMAQEIVNLFPSGFVKTTPVSGSEPTSENLKPIAVLVKYNSQDKIDGLSLAEMKELLRSIKNFETGDVFDYSPVGSNAEEKKIDEVKHTYTIAQRLIANNTTEMLNAVVKLPRVELLELTANNIESLENLDKLTKIVALNVDENLITTLDNVDWSKMEMITELDLSKNQISNIDKLKDLSPHLERLVVADCLLNGKFDFDFMKLKVHDVDFSGNYYNDFSYIIDKYEVKAKRNDSASIADYISDKGYSVKLYNQTVNIDYGVVGNENNEVITLNLPSIFKDIETIDPYRTTFGVTPVDGTVDEKGKKVIFSNYNMGVNTGKVRIDSIPSNVNNAENNSIGAGSVVNIRYTVGNGEVEPSNPGENVTPLDPTQPNDPSNPSNPSNPSESEDGDSPSTPGNPNDENTTLNPNDSTDGKNDATTDNTFIDEEQEGKTNFVYLYQPDVTISSLVDLLNFSSPQTGNTRTTRRVTSVNGKEDDLTNDNSRAFTTEVITTNFKFVDLTDSSKNIDKDMISEIVVIGDVDGDGDVDSIDSGYARALKYGTLYNSITDENERIRLTNAFKETANYRAADMNGDGIVSTSETAAILYYRAGLLNSFEAFVPNN